MQPTENKEKMPLHLVEHFASVQGEGMSAGKLSVFWRFSGCTTNCAWCDSSRLWKQLGTVTFAEAYAQMEVAGYFRKLKAGAHLVLTGGDPMLRQDEIAEFLLYAESRGEYVPGWYIEVETQGLTPPRPLLWGRVNQWNVSPKLANSGVPVERRYSSAVLNLLRIDAVNKYPVSFKFVVESLRDVEEVEAIAAQHAIPERFIWLMPLCSDRQSYIEKSRQVADWAIRYNYNFSPRLQLGIWDRTTGV